MKKEDLEKKFQEDTDWIVATDELSETEQYTRFKTFVEENNIDLNGNFQAESPVGDKYLDADELNELLKLVSSQIELKRVEDNSKNINLNLEGEGEGYESAEFVVEKKEGETLVEDNVSGEPGGLRIKVLSPEIANFNIQGKGRVPGAFTKYSGPPYDAVPQDELLKGFYKEQGLESQADNRDENRSQVYRRDVCLYTVEKSDASTEYHPRDESAYDLIAKELEITSPNSTITIDGGTKEERYDMIDSIKSNPDSKLTLDKATEDFYNKYKEEYASTNDDDNLYSL